MLLLCIYERKLVTDCSVGVADLHVPVSIFLGVASLICGMLLVFFLSMGDLPVQSFSCSEQFLLRRLFTILFICKQQVSQTR